MAADALFYQTIRFLKRVVRSDKPIKVRCLKFSDDLDGICIDNDTHFLIKISKGLTVGHAIDVLIHEIAHVEAWGKEKDPHGAAWGKAYSRIYREYLNGFLGN